MEALDDHDDVQNVYSNLNMTDEMLAAAAVRDRVRSPKSGNPTSRMAIVLFADCGCRTSRFELISMSIRSEFPDTLILDDPADLSLRLIFADWLDDQDNPRGEFVRVQTELLGWVPDLERRTSLLRRQEQLLRVRGGMARSVASYAQTLVLGRRAASRLVRC